MSHAIHRITKREYAVDLATTLNGVGGTLVAGRWHQRGQAVTYFAGSRSLSILELLAHLEIHEKDIPASLVAVMLELPSRYASPPIARRISREEMDRVDANWRQVGNETCRRIGSLWFQECEQIALLVPSAVVPDETNTVVNCVHPALPELMREAKYSVTALDLDQRIVELTPKASIRPAG